MVCCCPETQCSKKGRDQQIGAGGQEQSIPRGVRDKEPRFETGQARFSTGHPGCHLNPAPAGLGALALVHFVRVSRATRKLRLAYGRVPCTGRAVVGVKPSGIALKEQKARSDHPCRQRLPWLKAPKPAEAGLRWHPGDARYFVSPLSSPPSYAPPPFRPARLPLLHWRDRERDALRRSDW